MEIVTSHGTRGSDSINATPLGHGARSRTFQRGRICRAVGCSTVLSQYNPIATCSLHS
jgi:hypothetical protein